MHLSKKRRKSIQKLVPIVAVSLIALTIVGLLYGFFMYKGFYITSVYVNNETYSQQITQTVYDTLLEKRMYVFPANHTAFIPFSKIKEVLSTTYPEIKTVEVTRSWLHGINVTITLRTPTFQLENGLALDEDGIVYHEPQDIQALPFFYFSSQIPDSNHYKNTITLMKKISLRILPVEAVEVDTNNDVHYFFGNQKQSIIIPLDADHDTVWSTLLSALDTVPLSTLLQNDPHKVEYIDLRFGNKVFYKFKKEGSTLQASTSLPLSTSTQTIH